MSDLDFRFLPAAGAAPVAAVTALSEGGVSAFFPGDFFGAARPADGAFRADFFGAVDFAGAFRAGVPAADFFGAVFRDRPAPACFAGDFRAAVFPPADFFTADFFAADLPPAVFFGGDFLAADFPGAFFPAVFVAPFLAADFFAGDRFAGPLPAVFLAAAFFGAAFFGADFLVADFFAAAFFGADFFAAAFLVADFFGAAFFGAAFFAAAFFGPPFLAALFFAACFRAGDFPAAAFFAGAFRPADFPAAAFFTDAFFPAGFFPAAFLAADFFAAVVPVFFFRAADFFAVFRAALRAAAGRTEADLAVAGALSAGESDRGVLSFPASILAVAAMCTSLGVQLGQTDHVCGPQPGSPIAARIARVRGPGAERSRVAALGSPRLAGTKIRSRTVQRHRNVDAGRQIEVRQRVTTSHQVRRRPLPGRTRPTSSSP